MKPSFYISLLLYISVSLFSSCADEDEEDITTTPTNELIKITEGYALGAATKIELWAKGDFHAGYNEVFFALYDSVSEQEIIDAHIHLHPMMNMQTMSHSCPVEEPASEAINGLFPAAIMFTMPSGDMGSWTLEVNLHSHHNDKNGSIVFPIEVKNVTPSRVIVFADEITNDRYYLGYNFPKGMKVGVNEFEVIAFTMEEGEYVPAETLSIELEPEMPAMDHGSPNNENPKHKRAGHYIGKVNFTMTGDWRLNLHLSKGDASLGTRYFDVVVN